MEYWHLKDDTTQKFRDLRVIGPFWHELAYYQTDYVSPEWGAFDPTRIELRTSQMRKRLKKRDILYSGTPPSCSENTFSLFEALISAFVETFPLKVDGTAFVTFRPKIFLDLMDFDKSAYGTLSNGKPYNFKHIVLRSAPPEPLPIFGFSSPETAWPHIVVSGAFKEICDQHELTGLRFLLSYSSVT